MKLLLVSLFLVFAAEILICQPQIHIKDSDTLNWGKVKPIQTPLEGKVIIENNGTDTLVIFRVKPTCGCTASRLDNYRIPPGGHATVEVSLNLGTMTEQIHKTIEIKSSDADNPLVTVHLLTEVITPLKFAPSQMLPFREIIAHAENEAKVTVTNTTEDTITFKQIIYIPSNLSSNLKENMFLLPGQSFEIIAKITPENLGPFIGEIKFKTTHPDVPRVDLSARGTVIASPLPKN